MTSDKFNEAIKSINLMLKEANEAFNKITDYYRRENNIELDYRTPRHVHGELDHEIYPPEKHKHKQK